MVKYCSPKKNIKNKTLEHISCFDKKGLINIAKSFNHIYPKDKISIPKRFTDNILTTFWNILRLKGIIEDEVSIANTKLRLHQNLEAIDVLKAEAKFSELGKFIFKNLVKINISYT